MIVLLVSDNNSKLHSIMGSTKKYLIIVVTVEKHIVWVNYLRYNVHNDNKLYISLCKLIVLTN